MNLNSLEIKNLIYFPNLLEFLFKMVSALPKASKIGVENSIFSSTSIFKSKKNIIILKNKIRINLN